METMAGDLTNTGPAPDFSPFESDLYHCSACNYCVEATWAQRGIDHVCPTLLHHSPSYGYSGLGYLAQARAWHEGAALSLESLAERAFTCTTCGNCEEVCPIGLRPARVVLALRQALHQRDATPPAIAALRENVLAHDNPAGFPRQQRGAWAQDQTMGAAAGEPLLFLPGCAACHATPGEAQAAASVLAACGWRIESLGERESCCGAPLHEAGFAVDARARRAILDAAIRAHGAATISTLGIECLEALNDRPVSDDPREALRARHPMLLLRDALSAGVITLKPRADKPPPALVSVLDSCHATKKSHGNARDDDPAGTARAILIAAGCEITGGAAASRFALCCGAAGAMPVMNADAAGRMAKGVIASLAEPGAGTIVALSPLCLGHLKASGAGADTPQIFGLFEFISAHYEIIATQEVSAT
jgi:Fe-S oxidoreductase